ncbi:E3 ubiquitin-protein ligase ATL42-like [Aristolochia californica]|uniref:E3 ubiquitin-protein ligase ATL42-like n=1 Tax=Aristolochia californica TaxID=171875 RepID=UPI0035D8226B
MNLSLFFFLLFLFFNDAAAQQSQAVGPGDPTMDVPRSFRPSIAIVIGVLSIMFSLTFLLLMYAKFCHAAAAELFNNSPDPQNGLVHPGARFSGIDKTVIESLPFFRFSSLKGSKEGLECAVCLSRFEDSEVLRLLPKCKHAFHINCVDRWLENHSSCPLCRYKVDPEDLTIFKYSHSLRFSRDPSNLREEPNVELFVQREPDEGGSSRFSVGGSFRKIIDKGKKEELLIPEGGEKQQFLDKHEHKIIVSDVVFKNRWSDVNSSDLMFLNSEMLNLVSSRRFSSMESRSERFTAKQVPMEFEPSNDEKILQIKEEIEKKRQLERKVINLSRSYSASASTGLPSSSNLDDNSSKTSYNLDPSAKRSMSEITNLARFPDLGVKIKVRESASAPNNAKEERVRKLWLPIARRTLQWLAGRERRCRPPESGQDLIV